MKQLRIIIILFLLTIYHSIALFSIIADISAVK